MMPTTVRPRTIGRLAADEVPALLAFQREVFGQDSIQLDERHRRWLFDDNPHNNGDGPQIWVYRVRNRIVGEVAGIPFPLKVGAAYLHASWGIDLMVADAFRRHGIGRRLTEACAGFNDVTASLGISKEGRQTFRRAGWLDLGDVPLYVRPLKVGPMFAGHGRRGLAARMTAPVCQLAVRLADVVADRIADRRGVTFDEIPHFDHRVDALWSSASRDYQIIAQRDHRSLHWRFDAMPTPNRYRRFYLCDGKALRGYAVLRMGWREGIPTGSIVDFLSERGWLDPLVANCVRYLRQIGCAAVYCPASDQGVGRHLLGLAFLRRKASGIRLMVRPQSPRAAAAHDIQQRDHWFVTMADSDADYPRPWEKQ
jgi:GNAT superfamily N-acetyltransferase